MHEEIIVYLRENQSASSLALAQEFLKFQNPDPTIAHITIKGILEKDKRCYFGDDQLWHVSSFNQTGDTIKELKSIPWKIVYILTGACPHENKIFHISVWKVLPTPTAEINEWVENPDILSPEEYSSLVSTHDKPFEEHKKDERLFTIAKSCEHSVPIFLSSNHYALLMKQIAQAGKSFTDEAICISQLFTAAGIVLPRLLSLESLYSALFEREPQPIYAFRYGEALAECAYELIERCTTKGIVTFEDMESVQHNKNTAIDFSQKGFSYDDIANMPEKPGVYAFKTKDTSYLYIGKASNLKRRIMSYFWNMQERSEKVEQIQKDAYYLNTHICGSELESLIYEYRLIKKHEPQLNKNIEINERKGTFQPLQDCIILLPHAEEDKGMSFWFRRNQKIVIKPFHTDFQQSPLFCSELDSFFFCHKLPVHAFDFPEQEIVYRWVRYHSEMLVIVPVYRMSSGKEVYEGIKNYWRDVKKT